MNHYQRMICYLYEYNRGQKGANVGYVRLEQRGERCRVQIQMRGRNLEKSPVAAFFKQESTGVRLLKIREMQEGKGEWFCRVESRVDNLLEKGRSLEEMDGIFLYVSDVLHFASTWKLQDIYAGKVSWWGEEAEREEAKVSAKPADRPEYEKSAQKSEKSDINTEPEANRKQQMEWNAVREDAAGEHAKQNTKQAEDRNYVHHEKKTGVKTNYPWGNTVQGRFARQEEEIAVAKPDSKIYPGTAEDTYTDSQRQQFTADRELSVAELEEQTVCERCPFKRKELDYGKKMLVTFPAMRPFGTEYRGKCVRIEPQDLGCLPMKLWPLSGNTFLMQGYYNYRHLIFMEWEQSSYAIGVPGIYSEAAGEKGKSSGFTEFMAICGQRNCRGAFGYWLMPLSVR